MAITFPRDLPLVGLTSPVFEIQRVDYISPEGKGRIGAVTAGFPLWSASWALGAMRRLSLTEQRLADFDVIRSWVSSLRGSQRLFYGRDISRPYPSLNPRGVAGWDGNFSGWGVSSDRDVLSLVGGHADLKLSPGDYIGFAWGGTKRALVRVVESGSGASPSVSVEPAVPSIVPDGALAYAYKPTCLMRLTPDTQLMEVDQITKQMSGNIQAIQELIA